MKRNWWITVIVLIAISVVLDFLLLREHGEPEWLYFPGFYAVLGLLGAVVAAVVARLLGGGWLEKKEDYYTSEDDE
jgi:hypothetical protein